MQNPAGDCIALGIANIPLFSDRWWNGSTVVWSFKTSKIDSP